MGPETGSACCQGRDASKRLEAWQCPLWPTQIVSHRHGNNSWDGWGHTADPPCLKNVVEEELALVSRSQEQNWMVQDQL